MHGTKEKQVSEFRTEKDSLGEVRVPADALWGAQTQRAIDNFPVSGQPMPPEFIVAVAQVKRASAQANASLGLLAPELRDAIVLACDNLDRKSTRLNSSHVKISYAVF